MPGALQEGEQSLAGVAEAPGQAIDPQATVRIEHDLDDGRAGSCVIIIKRPHEKVVRRVF
jgi:hypothetical protein